MGTPYQYVLVSDNPQREARFRKKRAENAKKKGGRGSFYAFHGSAIGNWHSIFRGGLRNYSNTDKMSCGAAYGPGIYMASNASTSFGYMAAGAGWDKSMMIKSGTASTIACIALCEGTHSPVLQLNTT
jgi:poly [ADP-ribose] polymerase 6/8